MANIVQVTGVKEVLLNMKFREKMLEDGMVRGLKKAGLHLQRESQKKAPVEFGNLKASAYTRAEGRGWKTSVLVGYTAAYALHVHEAVGMVLRGQPRTPSPPHQGRYWDPQGQAQAKFLEEPAKTEIPKMRKIIVDEAKI